MYTHLPHDVGSYKEKSLALGLSRCNGMVQEVPGLWNQQSVEVSISKVRYGFLVLAATLRK